MICKPSDRYTGVKYLLALIPLVLAFHTRPVFQKFQFTGFAQGTTWSVTYYATEAPVSTPQIDSVLHKIDSSLSLYKPYSLINRFNRSERGIPVDKHFLEVVKKSIEVYHSTGGLFDITVRPLVEAWGFGVDAADTEPDTERIRSILPCVGTPKIRIRRDSLIKENPCVTIDVNGIAQGYSVDVIGRFLESRGIHNYIIELGGEIRVKGRKKPSGKKMRIGIETPVEEDPADIDPQAPVTVTSRVIELAKGSITTSGNYRKYILSQGKKLGHIIHPKTGMPVDNELISVTVCARDAMTSDAYDNALMLMGLEEALKFVEKKRNLSAHFIYRTPDGAIKDTASKRFPKEVLLPVSEME